MPQQDPRKSNRCQFGANSQDLDQCEDAATTRIGGVPLCSYHGSREPKEEDLEPDPEPDPDPEPQTELKIVQLLELTTSKDHRGCVLGLSSNGATWVLVKNHQQNPQWEPFCPNIHHQP